MTRTPYFACLLWGTVGILLFFPLRSLAAESFVAPTQEAATPTVTQQTDPVEFEAIRAEFFSGDARPREKGVPWFRNMETVSFAGDEEPHPLQSFPGLEVLRRKNGFYLGREGAERLLGSSAGVYDAALPWPELAVADVDFDDVPDFFFLHSPGYSDSIYRFASGKEADVPVASVFQPFAGKTPPDSPDPFPEYAIFADDVGGMPGFLPQERAIEFYRKKGPYYDAERWCFDAGRYYLCEKHKQAYYPASDNNDLVFTRVARFDEKGNLLGASCRPLEGEEKESLRLTAVVEVPLYVEPAESPSGTALPPGAVVRMLDYRLVEGSEDMRLWYRVQDETDPARMGWCCVTVDIPTIQDGKLIFAKTHNESVRSYLENPYAVVSLERVEKGAKAVLRMKDGETFFIESIPVMFPYEVE